MFSVDAGNPLLRKLAHVGVPLRVVVNIVHDQEAGVFVATSPNLRGLVAEAPTLEGLIEEVKASAIEILDGELMSRPRSAPVLVLGQDGLACA